MSGKNRALRRAAQDQGVDRGQIRQGLQATLRVLVLILEQCDYHGSRTASAVAVRALTGRWHFEVLLILSSEELPIAYSRRAESIVGRHAHGMSTRVYSAFISSPWTPPD